MSNGALDELELEELEIEAKSLTRYIFVSANSAASVSQVIVRGLS